MSRKKKVAGASSSRAQAEPMEQNAPATLVPELRFPEFLEDGDWKDEKLEKHLTESRVRGSSGNVAKKLTVKLWGKGVFEKEESTLGSINTQYYKRKSGQFIYSKLDFLNQAFGIVPTSLDGYESTVDLPCFDIGKGLHPTFLLEYVQRKEFYKAFGEIADGGRKAKRIQVETFYSFPITLPPSKAEQQKIADCLGSLDDLIAAHSRKLAALQNHKKGLLQQLFPAEGTTTPKLRFPGFEGEWETVPLGEIAKFGSGGTPAKSNPSYWNGEIPWISASSMHETFVYDSALRVTTEAIGNGTRIAKKGTLLILVRGSMLFKRVPLCLAMRDVAFNQDVKSLVLRKGINSLFLLSQLFSSESRIPVNRTGIGAGKIDTEDLKSIELFLPTLAEQQKIADCLSALDTLINAQTEQITALKEHKKGLMQKLFPNP